MYPVRVSTFDAWHQAASALIAACISPDRIDWGDAQGQGLFVDNAQTLDLDVPRIELPTAILAQLREACAWLGEERWALPYRVIWRWLQGERSAFMPGDPDGTRLARRIRTVLGAAHQMKGFLRFRERPDGAEGPRFVAWYEPSHDVLASVAQHFAERMGKASWLISTPHGSVSCDGQRLAFGPPGVKPLQEADLAEELWLDYYRSTFNPDRLNLSLMQSHLPHQHWKNLPEASLIPMLASQAGLGQDRQRTAVAPSANAAANHDCAPDRAQRAASLADELENCRQCELWEHATYPVNGSGPANARIVIVGEQADDHDDLIGEPFSGEAGRYLEELLREAGLSRDEVYLTHAVKHFRFETRQLQRIYRTPGPAHIAACRGWLLQELSCLPVRVIVALGQTAAIALELSKQEKSVPPEALPGKTGAYRVITSWHPAYALRAPDPAERTKVRAHIVASLRLAHQLTKEEKPYPDQASFAEHL